MAFDEDLDEFFDPDEFAEVATIKTPQGATLRTANVILETPLDALSLYPDAAVEQLQPRVHCRTSALAGIVRDSIFEIGGAVYRVVTRTDDGHGLSILTMRKQ